jgi:hypothetical protein
MESKLQTSKGLIQIKVRWKYDLAKLLRRMKILTTDQASDSLLSHVEGVARSVVVWKGFSLAAEILHVCKQVNNGINLETGLDHWCPFYTSFTGPELKY